MQPQDAHGPLPKYFADTQGILLDPTNDSAMLKMRPNAVEETQAYVEQQGNGPQQKAPTACEQIQPAE